MTKIQFRRDTAAAWTTANPVLSAGEPALETDTGKKKTGDGITAWISLPYEAPNATSLAATYLSRKPIPVGLTDATPVAASNQTTGQTSEFPIQIPFDCSDIRLVYSNYNVTSPGAAGIDGENTVTYTPIRASIKAPDGTIRRVTFNGRTDGTIDPGGKVTTDVHAIELAKGDVIWIRTYNGSASWYPTYANWIGTAGTGGSTAGDLTAPGSAAISPGVTWMYGPVAILATPKTVGSPGVAVIADSINTGVFVDTSGINGPTTYYPTATTGGFITRALYGKAGMVNFAISSAKASVMKLYSSHYRRFQLLEHCSHVICEMGVNDINGGDNLATVQGSLLALWTAAAQRGCRVWQTTITPRTNSTDSWATTTNQTVANSGFEAVRVALNNWIRAGAPIDPTTKAAVAINTSGALLLGTLGHPLSGYFDVADGAESARNSGIWKPNYTIDGLHPSATGRDPLNGLGQAINVSAMY